ncbi:MAG: sulfatase-like hydrolase/transferase [Acidobacteriota bacterium]
MDAPSRSRRYTFRVLFFVALSATLGGRFAIRAAPEPARRQARPNVLLITVDTLRPDALGWVAGRNATPVIDSLANASFRFSGAVSPVPLTLPAHVSILTGELPRRHGVRDNGQVLGSERPTLGRALKANGYATAAFVSGYPLRKVFGLDGGFDVYDDHLPAGSEGWVERPATQTTAAALAWVARAHSPWFLWIHYYDPHDPYTPPRAYLRPGPRGAYDGEVAYVDSALGALLRGLPAAPPESRITVLAGDHGESLGEHGESTHGFFLYDSTVLVPLLFHAPGRVTPRVSSLPARLIDITPTLLDLLRLPPLAGMDGRSLTPIFSGAKDDPGTAYLETLQPWLAYGWAPLSGVREAAWKLVRAPRPEVYDLRADPHEAKNLFSGSREQTVALLRELQRFEAAPATDSRRIADPETVARLRSLGYLGSGSSGPPAGRTLADPKDRLAERVLLLQGEDLLRTGKFDQAVAVFSEALRRDPGNHFALFRTGVALSKRGDLLRAIAPLEEAVRLDPEQAESQFALADVLTRSGQYARAIPHWMETARLQPRRPAAWSNLGTALGRAGKLTEAAVAFARAVEVDPGDPLLLANLAFAERGTGKDEAALLHLARAASLSGDRFPYPGTLGLLYLKKGETAQAAPWLRRSQTKEPDFAEARFELATIEIYAGDKVAAKKDLGTALTASPSLRSRAAANPALASLLR